MSAASATLGQSSALVGQQIAALEQRVGLRLLHRTTRRQSLTDFGATYFEQCRDILERVANAEQAAELQQTRLQGRLRIAAPVTFGSEALVPALGSYRLAAPDVVLDIGLSDRNVDLVEEGFDIAFRIGDLHDGTMVARSLAPYKMVVCASPDYLTRRGSPKDPDELAGHQTVAFTPSARSAWKFKRDGNETSVTPPRMVFVNSGQAVRAAARAGLGIIMQPELLVKRDLETGCLIKLFPEWSLRERPMWLLYQRDRRMTPRLRSFISFALATFGTV